MKRIGNSEMVARAQARLVHEQRFAEVLVAEWGSGLVFYELAAPHDNPQLGYYAEWARIALRDERHSLYSVSVKRGRRWEQVGDEGTLEQCLDRLKDLLTRAAAHRRLPGDDAQHRADIVNHVFGAGDRVIVVFVAELAGQGGPHP